MTAPAGSASYPPRQNAPTAPDPYSANEPSYRRSSTGRQPTYESPVNPDYDSDADGPGFEENGQRADQNRRLSMRRYDEWYTSGGLPPLRTESISKPRAQEPSNYVESSGRRYASDPLSAVSPLSPATTGLRQERPSNDIRRSSVQGRSPLQRLEITLDEKTKEEKRAKVLEVEMAAQQRLDKARVASQRANDAIAGQRDPSGVQRWDSARPPQTSAADPSGIKRSRAIREGPSRPNGYSSALEYGPSSRLPPRTTNNPMSTKPSQPPVSAPFRYDGGYRSFSDPTGSDRNDVPRPAPTSQNHAIQQRNQRVVGDATLASGATAAGASQSRADWKLPGPGVGRSGSRKLQKDPPSERRISGPWNPENAPSGGQQFLRDPREQGGPPVSLDANSRQNVQDAANYGPVHNAPPQTAPDQQGRKAVGFNEQAPAVIPPMSENEKRHHRFSNIMHHGPLDNSRRYQPGPQLDQWDKIRTARLTDEDLDLTAGPVVREGQDRSTAWWEKSASGRRRSSSAAVPAPTVTDNGYFEPESGQTCFHPLLYLKCGPLLRFRGIYKESRSDSPGVKEIWRGSIMIVTIDSRSNYSRGPPILRLFNQPVELLPPPPAQIDATGSGHQLAPEYVDPIAGQIKMSRIGKTLHVKPVELLEEHRDLSRIENDSGLFEERPSGSTSGNTYANQAPGARPNVTGALPVAKDGEKLGKVRELPGVRLHVERGVTFWKWNIEITLSPHQQRIAYRINRGPAVGFWVPAQNEAMNMMFHSSNGFSLSVRPDDFSGPDPLWRDVLNSHQTRPFHVMIGGGDQVYMDACTVQTTYFREWTEHKNPHYKDHAPFTAEMQDELEEFYLNRYAMWFSQGLFGMAASQIPMVNIWNSHDIDGHGGYPHHTMSSPVSTGISAMAFKYYVLFQDQSVPMETEADEPSWLLGAEPGPYIGQLSRSLFMSMGNGVQFLGLDCRTERTRDEILCDGTWDKVFDRCHAEIRKGETQHLIVLLAVPIAYPRLSFLENVLDPIKMIGRTGIFGGLVNKFDGGVEILDDLDDHWTAKNHKRERNWFIQELQELAAEKSIRVTILSGDVHLAAVGRFYSNKNLGIPKDRDHRYMPNIISSAIVNTPAGDMLADVLNRRNKIHHLDDDTDEDMIAMFPHDVDGKPRHNTHLLPRRNWCSIRSYHPGTTPPPTPPMPEDEDESEPQSGATMPDNASYDSEERPSGIRRTLSIGRRSLERPRAMLRRLSGGAQNTPPIAYYNAMGGRPQHQRRASSDDALMNRPTETSNSYFPSGPNERGASSDSSLNRAQRPTLYHRRPSGLTAKEERRLADEERGGHIDLHNGLDLRLNVENVRGDPAGTTTEYRLLVPALDYRGVPDENTARRKGRMRSFFASLTERGQRHSPGTSPLQSPAEGTGADGTASTTHLDHSNPTPPGGRSNVAALNGQNQRLQQLQAQDPTPERPSRDGGLGRPPGAQARANAVNALPNSPTLPQKQSIPDSNLYPAVQNPQPMRGSSSNPSHSSAPKSRTDDSYAPSATMAEPSASVGGAGQTRIGDDGRPARRRWRGDSYDEDAVLPSAGVGPPAAGRNQSRWSDEYDDDGEVVVAPSQQRWSSPVREEERRGVLGRVRDRVSGWRAWRM